MKIKRNQIKLLSFDSNITVQFINIYNDQSSDFILFLTNE